jgi:hypothetical protein
MPVFEHQHRRSIRKLRLQVPVDHRTTQTEMLTKQGNLAGNSNMYTSVLGLTQTNSGSGFVQHCVLPVAHPTLSSNWGAEL